VNKRKETFVALEAAQALLGHGAQEGHVAGRSSEGGGAMGSREEFFLEPDHLGNMKIRAQGIQ